jgi:hypothetical protein
MSAGEIAAVLGTTEPAAQKRISRAIERLRKLFAERSITIGTSSLGISLATRAVIAAPVGIADAISKAAAQTLLTQAVSVTVTQEILMTTTQKAVIGMSLALAIGTGVFEVQQSVQRHREAARSAQAFSDFDHRFQALRREHDTALGEIEILRNDAERMKHETAEVHRLRGEVTQLRHTAQARTTGEFTGIRATENALTSWLSRTDAFKKAQYVMPQKAIPELILLTQEDWLEMAKEPDHSLAQTQADLPELNRRMLTIAREQAKKKFGFLLSRALDRYLEAHGDLLPSDVSLLRPFFEDRQPHLGGSANLVSDAMLRRYEVLQSGTFATVPATDAVILAETAPADENFATRLVIGKHWLQTARDSDAAHWKNVSGRGSPRSP